MPALSFLKCVLSAAMLAFGGAAFATAAQPAGDNLPLRCEGAACAKVATAVSWPDVRLEDPTTPFAVHGTFTFQLPKGPLEFLLQDNGFIARYADRRWIVSGPQPASLPIAQRCASRTERAAEPFRRWIRRG